MSFYQQKGFPLTLSPSTLLTLIYQLLDFEIEEIKEFKTTRLWKCFPSLSIETNFYRSSRRVDLKNSRKHDI